MTDIKQKIRDIIIEDIFGENLKQNMRSVIINTAIDEILALFPIWKKFDAYNPKTWPEQNKRYLLTNRDKEIVADWWHYTCWRGFPEGEIIAYRELPEPYKIPDDTPSEI